MLFCDFHNRERPSPAEEPLNQFVPLVEFKFDSPRGQYTGATMNPGIAYVAVAWQVAAEAIILLDRAGGTARVFALFNDLIPSVFGTPLITDKPARSQIAWWGVNRALHCSPSALMSIRTARISSGRQSATSSNATQTS
jgi:hypothetical protein